MKNVFIGLMCIVTFIFIVSMFVFRSNNSYAAELPDGQT